MSRRSLPALVLVVLGLVGLVIVGRDVPEPPDAVLRGHGRDLDARGRCIGRTHGELVLPRRADRRRRRGRR